MDGTLVDSKKDITISVNYVRKENHNLPPLSEEYVVEAINRKKRNLAYEFYQTSIYEKKDQELFETHYKTQCVKNVKLFDGIEEMLEKLKQNGVLMAVATNAPTPFAHLMLNAVGIKEYFFEIVGADKARSKPDPLMLEMILQKCNYDKQQDQAWMVGDNQKDIEVAKNVGIEAIYATWGFQSDVSHHLKAKKPQDILDIVLQ